MPDFAVSATDDDLQLLDLLAALWRRKQWWAACAAAGLALAGGFSLVPSDKMTAQLLVNIDQGPKVLASVSKDFDGPNTRYFAVAVQPAQTAEEVQISLQNLISQNAPQGWKVEPLKVGKVASNSIIAVEAQATAKSIAEVDTNLSSIAASYRRQVLLQQGKRVVAPPSLNWLEVRTFKPSVRPRSSLLALGSLAGLSFGIAAAMLVEKRENKVYSKARLVSCLNLPVLAKIPSSPLAGGAVHAELFQLAQQLDPDLRWHVLSVANPHPLVQPLVHALHQYFPEIKLEPGQPLLANPLTTLPSGQGHGVLLVVEPGFNSAQALQEAARVMAQLPGLRAAGLVLVGQPLPPELRSY